MAISIDKEIELTIQPQALDFYASRSRTDVLDKINRHLQEYKPKGWFAFFYGSILHGLSTCDDAIDICITNIDSSTATQQPIITHDNVNFERLDISDNTDVVNVKSLASRLPSVLKNNTYSIITAFPQGSVLFLNVRGPRFRNPIQFNISVDNTLDVERSNLITEYLALDNRIKPFLLALKQFIKKRKINNDENGYPNSYVYVMMGLYFLMFVQGSPVIPCLHAMPDIRTPCNFPVCRSKCNEKVQGFDVTYHDCARIDRIAECNTSKKNYNIKVYGTPWVSKNTKSSGELLIEVFGWFSHIATILEPKSINSKEPPVLQPEWNRNFMVFADIFDPKLNIAASCTVTGAKVINQEFTNAYIKLKEGASFTEVLNAKYTILTPITITKPHTFTRNGS